MLGAKEKKNRIRYNKKKYFNFNFNFLLEKMKIEILNRRIEIKRFYVCDICFKSSVKSTIYIYERLVVDLK